MTLGAGAWHFASPQAHISIFDGEGMGFIPQREGGGGVEGYWGRRMLCVTAHGLAVFDSLWCLGLPKSLHTFVLLVCRHPGSPHAFIFFEYRASGEPTCIHLFGVWGTSEAHTHPFEVLWAVLWLCFCGEGCKASKPG